MSTASNPNLDASTAAFAAAHPTLGTAKVNRDSNGSVLGSLPANESADHPTAELMNGYDDLHLAVQKRVAGTLRSVREHGAAGDGVTDDTTAIQAAIDVGPGVVFFPAGTYLVTSITRPGGVTLQGAGVPHTMIRAASPSGPIIGSGVASYIASPTQRGGGVFDLVVDGSARTNGGSVGISLAGCYDAVIKRCTIQNVETGLYLAHSAYWNQIESNRIAVVDTGAIVTENANENAFRSTHVLDCEWGFTVDEGSNGVSNVTFDHCAVEQPSMGGYQIVATTANAVDGVTIDKPRIERSSSGGTGVSWTEQCRGVEVRQPFFVNIATPVSGPLGSGAQVVRRGQHKQGLRVPTLADYADDSHGLLYWLSGRAHLRDSGNNGFASLQLDQLWLADGPRIVSISASTNGGDPNGQIVAGLGSKCLSGNGNTYRKTTASGSTGWVVEGTATHYESFGFDTATADADVWVSFGPHLIETAQTNAPRAYHVWRVPRSGTVSTITLTAEDDPGVTTCEFYEPDGATVVGAVSSAGVTAVVSGTTGADTLYEVTYTFPTPVVLAGGSRVLLALNMTTSIGEVFGHIELGS